MRKRLAIRVEMMPKDTNAWGKIFGGVIMGHMDVAGGDAARKHTGRHCVTRAVKSMEFIAPVAVGDIVGFYTKVVKVGRTSITVQIEAIAERFDTGEQIKVARGEIVYVAIDEKGRSTPIKEEKSES